ncbi:TonB-dependent receptor [Maribacter sp. LLG6340-A2]|uniref:TonB-dependent receptor n=1 Tax=Maribacter sp. LLG6340-A2 TaxID=3160834 RepID=UPI0038701D74
MKVKINLLLLLIGFTIFQASLSAQNGGPSQNELEQVFLNEDITRTYYNDQDYLKVWQERVLLHVDKEIINKDSPLFFKAYLFTGPNRLRATLSKVLKLELLNENDMVIATNYYKVSDGMANGAFVAPKKLPKGSYTLRAYTRWMQNYGKSYYYNIKLNTDSFNEFSNSRKEKDITNVEFYPEGGNLVNNLDNWLLIKAIDKEGKRVSIDGDIVAENNMVTSVKPYGEGVSSVKFTPIEGKKYMLKTKNGDFFALPNSISQGVLINVNNLNAENLTIRIQKTEEFSNSKVWLKGEMGDVTYFEKKLDLKSSSTIIEVPKEGIPFGILNIKLINENGVQLAQRPVPIEINNNLNISLTKLNHDNEGEISYKVKVMDLQGEPKETQVSFSAVGFSSIGLDKEVKKIIDEKKLDVKDLKSSFNIQREKLYKNDISVLTFVNQKNELPVQDIPDNIKYPFQQGLDLYGYAYNLYDELLPNTKIQIYGVSEKDMVFKEIVTNGKGILRLEDLQFEGETELVFRTTGDATRNRLVKFIPLEETGQNLGKNVKKDRAEDYQVKKGDIVQSSSWQPIDEDRLIELEEVSVMDKKIENKKKGARSVYGIEPSRVVFQDPKRPKTIPQMFLGIPGVQVMGLGSMTPRVVLPKAAGLGPVLWVLDGMPLSQESNSALGIYSGLPEIMSFLPAVDVERIEILFGPKASIYGSRATGGAIVIYTRSGSFLDATKRKEAFIKFQGYSQTANFEEYQKDLFKNNKSSKNKLLTLFWDTEIMTDDKGEAIINFKLPNESTILELKATAVTENGDIGELNIVN